MSNLNLTNMETSSDGKKPKITQILWIIASIVFLGILMIIAYLLGNKS